MTTPNLFHAWLLAMGCIVGAVLLIEAIKWWFRRYWPAIWRLIALDTPAAGLPCPECGHESELHGDINACRNCGEVW